MSATTPVAPGSGAAPVAPSPIGINPPSRRGRSTRLIGDIIVDFGYASRERVDQAVEAGRNQGKPTGRVLLDMGALTPDQLARVVAERFGLDHVDLTQFKVDMEAANLIEPAAARRLGAVPIGRPDPGTIYLAMSDPSNVLAIDDIRMLTGLEVTPTVASPDDIALLLKRLTSLDEAVEEIVEDERPTVTEVALETNQDAPVVKLVQSIVAQAVEHGASDIHFAATEGDMTVQFRVDGVLAPPVAVPRHMRQEVISRIKIMADLDIAERRTPQDGRMSVNVEGGSVDVRVVTLPLVMGESAVMRILDKRGSIMDLEHMGMLPEERERFRKASQKSYGAVLVTGPTGSGKSTSLYAALDTLNNGTTSIITIEDPVEYRMEGVRQMQVNARAGVTFATGLRSMLRADPDVVMVGEIRDRETAQIAIEAALTGHLVLSTLHTNDAPSAITRLVEMGIEPFLVASAIDCVVAQRLARKLCENCKQEVVHSTESLVESGFVVTEDLRAFEAVGCTRCSGTGYKGRTGLYEVMTVSEEIRSLTLQRQPADRVAAVAEADGMARLRDDGLIKVTRGETSIAEIARVVGSS
jgi:type IV pilus assembly protein PilB